MDHRRSTENSQDDNSSVNELLKNLKRFTPTPKDLEYLDKDKEHK